MDGFGRVRSTVNQAGVQTRVERDACGRTTFESYPYTTGTGPTGVGSTYDALHRPVTVTDGVGTGTPTSTSYTYPSGAWSSPIPKNRSTTYRYSAFGDPSDARLVLVWDADNKLTRYGYDAFGNLTRVNGPNATGAVGSLPERTWTYDHRNLLQSDSQPERGTTTYTVDARLGTSRQSRMPTGRRSCPTSGDDRLSKRDAPGTDGNLELHYDPVGRIDRMASPTLNSPTTETTYGYDAAGRLRWRADLVNGLSFGSAYRSSAEWRARRGSRIPRRAR